MRSLSGPGGDPRWVAQWSLRTDVNLGGEYSTKLPQQVRVWRDADTRSGTVTCGDGRRWTWCLLSQAGGRGSFALRAAVHSTASGPRIECNQVTASALSEERLNGPPVLVLAG